MFVATSFVLVMALEACLNMSYRIVSKQVDGPSLFVCYHGRFSHSMQVNEDGLSVSSSACYLTYFPSIIALHFATC